jgi:DNA polymerase III epsilon subunit-like protein
MKKTVVFFDLETGGLTLDHPDIQIAAIAVRDWEILEEFEVKIQFDEAVCTREALDANSYDPKVWAEEAIPELPALKKFQAFLRKHASVKKISKRDKIYRVARLAGHNVVSFDMPRIINRFQSYEGLFLPADYKALDTFPLSLWYEELYHVDFGGNRLTQLAEYFEIDTENAHDALADVRMTAKVAEKMFKGIVGLEERLG